MKLDNVFGKDIPKFIQIIPGEFDVSHGWQRLFALDSEGQVWELVHRESYIRWERIEAERLL